MEMVAGSEVSHAVAAMYQYRASSLVARASGNNVRSKDIFP